MDAQAMQGYGPAIRQLIVPGYEAGCCDISDCRPADYRIRTENGRTQYEVFIRRLTPDGSGWEGGTNKWEPVPDEAVIPPDQRKGIPFPVACWIVARTSYHNGYLCFSPGSGS
jgi:hypothetical protein